MFRKIILVVLVVIAVFWLVPIQVKFPKQEFTKAEKVHIEELFKKNNLSLTHFYPTRVNIYDKNFDVRGQQIYEGVILDDELIFHFKEPGVLDSISGDPPTNIPISLDPKISNTKLYENINKPISMLRGPITFPPTPAISATVATIIARFHTKSLAPMAVQLAIQNDQNIAIQNWRLVWIIQPLPFGYPMVWLDAMIGKVIGIDDGIRTVF